jgi:hypothetical protein
MTPENLALANLSEVVGHVFDATALICDICLDILSPYETAVADQLLADWRGPIARILGPLPIFCRRCATKILEWEPDGWRATPGRVVVR